MIKTLPIIIQIMKISMADLEDLKVLTKIIEFLAILQLNINLLIY